MRRIGVNKRGQEMTLSTIIMIVLGIAVLVFLIFGFSTGWKNMWDKVTIYGGQDNVNTIKQACAIACSTGDSYGFCTQSRNTILADGRVNGTATCNQLVDKTNFENKKDNSKNGDSVEIGIESCTPLCQ